MDERTVSMCRVPKQPILQGNRECAGRRACNASRAKSETDTDDRGQVPEHVRQPRQVRK